MHAFYKTRFSREEWLSGCDRRDWADLSGHRRWYLRAAEYGLSPNVGLIFDWLRRACFRQVSCEDFSAAIATGASTRTIWSLFFRSLVHWLEQAGVKACRESLQHRFPEVLAACHAAVPFVTRLDIDPAAQHFRNSARRALQRLRPNLRACVCAVTSNGICDALAGWYWLAPSLALEGWSVFFAALSACPVLRVSENIGRRFVTRRM